MKKDLIAVYGSAEKPLVIGNIDIPCYVLNNDQRVISQGGLLKALGMSTGGSKTTGVRKIDEFIDNTSLKPFISNDLSTRAKNPIKFKISDGNIAYGYEGGILVDICDAIMQAKKEGKSFRNKAVAEHAEILIRAFAKTGIIALIDEATGYQNVREKDALEKFLDKFLLEERAKWIPTFPDEFFEMIFKMKKWTWNYASTKKPQVVGYYINDFVYSRIAPNVLTLLREKNPVLQYGDKKHRRFKHPQFIDEDYGHPKLREHLRALIALGKASGYNWNTFKRYVERAFPKFGDTPELPYPDDTP